MDIEDISPVGIIGGILGGILSTLMSIQMVGEGAMGTFTIVATFVATAFVCYMITDKILG